MDRVSEAALGSADLDVFLQNLVTSTLTGTEAVDTCVVLLREGDMLRVRAAAGLEEELRTRFSVRIGEGFAGQVAAEGQPLFLRHAADDPRVKSPAMRAKGVRALYAVALKREARVIGAQAAVPNDGEQSDVGNRESADPRRPEARRDGAALPRRCEP